MRGMVIVALMALSIGSLSFGAADATPGFGRSTLNSETAASSPIDEAGYVVRCHKVRVWRDTPHGPRRAWVRRCHRVWRDY